MPHVQHNAKLNHLLVEIGRSLLQYVGQCSCWSSRSDTALEQEFSKLVEIQRQHVEELTLLLSDRRYDIDFGGFSATFTDLHFLSLKYLLKPIMANQQKIVSELEEAAHNCVDDPEAATLIEQILAAERQICDKLGSLAKKPAGAAA